MIDWLNTAGVMGYGCETKNKYKIKNSLGQVTPPPLLYSIQEPGTHNMYTN